MKEKPTILFIEVQEPLPFFEHLKDVFMHLVIAHPFKPGRRRETGVTYKAPLWDKSTQKKERRKRKAKTAV